jgi:predicted nicotinamide N-methyase
LDAEPHPGSALPLAPVPPSESLIASLAPTLSVPGRPDLVASQAPALFALWEAWEKESGAQQDIPYWATVWPAALLSAEFLAEAPESVRGKTVLDLGCGCGMVGIAAARAGAARAIANDIDPVALWMAARNASANAVGMETLGGDLLREPPRKEWDVILAADLFYDKTVAKAMLAWLRVARSQGARVLIADASRPFSPRTGITVLRERRFATDSDLEGTAERTVRLLDYLP